MGGRCEHGDVRTGFTKDGEILDQINNHRFIRWTLLHAVTWFTLI
jgi:hypothetical protein